MSRLRLAPSCRAYRELGPSAFATHQEQVGDIGSSYRQDQADSREQDTERGVDVADNHVLEGTNHRTEVDEARSGRSSIEFRQHRGEFGGRMIGSHTAAQTPKDLDVPKDAGAKVLVGLDVGQAVERRPDLGAARVREVRGHDPCDSEGSVLQV